MKKFKLFTVIADHEMSGVLGDRLFTRGDFRIVWYGLGEMMKWRWHGNHIDLGGLSIYDWSPRWQWFWRGVSILIKPLRMWYHWKYCKGWRKQS